MSVFEQKLEKLIEHIKKEYEKPKKALKSFVKEAKELRKLVKELQEESLPMCACPARGHKFKLKAKN